MKYAHWHDAMADEIMALELYHTWFVMPLLLGKHAIKSKWIYKIKYKFDGSIKRYKARLVVKDYTQAEGLDYYETFTLVVELVTVSYVIAVASTKYKPLYQIDVNNTFLHGDLNEKFYIQLPPDFSRMGKKGE